MEIPNGHDPVNSVLVRAIMVGWLMLELAVLVFVCFEIARVS